MKTLSRHGIVAERKTASGAKRWSVGIVLLVWFLSSLACAQSGYVSAGDLTATADVPPAGQGGAGDPFISPTSGPTQESMLDTIIQTPEPPGTEEISSPTMPTETSTPTATPTQVGTPLPPILYTSLPGDTLPALAKRFGVSPEEITRAQSNEPLPERSLIQPGVLLLIPNRLGEVSPPDHLLPDSEIVFSPSALDFDIDAFVREAGGYLSTYREYLGNGWNTGAQVVMRVAVENSINPRLLLALLEYQSGWVYGQPSNLAQTDYPLGWVHLDRKGLYKQLNWAMQKISLGYYSWRDGTITSVTFPDGTSLRIAPEINAGTAALLYYFAQLNDRLIWNGILYGPESFSRLHEEMFGNPWLRAQAVEPLLPLNLTQPVLELPYMPGRAWSFSGGPHSAWAKDGARAALDFAPPSMESGCVPSNDWVTAVAPGLVTRAAEGLVVVDLDGDGYEQTGWVILYLHVSTKDRVQAGEVVEQDDRLGHPSCEGGSSTGTHVHIARKYNGEWVLADGPLPFVLSGWEARAGELPYQGWMIKDDQTVKASPSGSSETLVTRPRQ